jgi:ATP-dependent helicase Lhr and Lhr-like helicase
MTSLPSSSFESLSEPVRKWIWKQNWPSLRDIQAKAIPAVLAGGDVVLSANTAAGKTEAAFLPLLTSIGQEGRSADGFAILYVSPLKALINDQFRRLESLCETCGVLLHKWHGDVSADAKSRARKRPTGVVLITPESLEALLVHRSAEAPRMFKNLQAVVIDELHAFIGTERGMQLQSILSRIEVLSSRDRIDRIGLSATLGNMALAAEALRPGFGDKVTIVEGDDVGNGIRLQIRGYRKPLLLRFNDTVEDLENAENVGVAVQQDDEGEVRSTEIPEAVARDLFKFLRGRSNLLFAGSRSAVEVYADHLRSMCEEASLPNEFFPHHGNLSKAVREDVEVRLRDDPRPTTAVATTTLELGIDIGDVETVAQIGPGFSVASLRQRLGRSGRRAGKPATLRIFAIEPTLTPGADPVSRLHLNLVQSVAMVECLREKWCEPPMPAGLHLSTLIHQTMALIVQMGGVKPLQAWAQLCQKGPFKAIDKALYANLLKCMASPENRLIEQSPDGHLMIGELGERITESYEFYPVFATPREYRVINEGRTLGTYPVSAVARGETIIFTGRRWTVVEVDDRANVIIVAAAKKGKPPKFSGDGGSIDDHIVETMLRVLQSTDRFSYLDETAAELLESARTAFKELRLDKTSVIPYGTGALIFPWTGTRKLRTLFLALLNRNFEASQFGHVIELQECTMDGVLESLRELSSSPAPDGRILAQRMAMPHFAKFDYLLSPELMEQVTIVERLEVAALPEIARSIVGPLS